MYRTVFGADDVPVERAAAKLAHFLTVTMFLAAKGPGTADNLGAIRHDPADDNAGTLHDDEVVTVEERYDRVGRFFDADDVVGVDVHSLLVHTRQKYHVAT